MSIDWKFLNTKTEELNSLSLFKDTDNTTVREVVFSGLYARLSDLNKLFSFGNGNILAVWADTLVIDDPTFNASGVVVICRNIDVSMLQNEALPIRVPEGNNTSVLEFVVKESTGSMPLKLTTTLEKDGKPLFTVPFCRDVYQAAYFTLDSSGNCSSEIKTDPSQFKDVFNRSWAFNSLKASFAAASWLIDSGEQNDLETAKSMLSWVVSSIQILVNEGIPQAFMELYTQASSMLISINIEKGSCYVPILSLNFYENQANKLISALENYENNLNNLNVREDIQEAVQEISKTVDAAAKDQEVPLKIDIDNVMLNAKSLKNNIDGLRQAFDLQYIDAETRRNLMMAKITDVKTTKFLKAYFGITVSVTKAGVAVGQMAAGKEDQGGEILSNLVEAVKNGYEAIEILANEYEYGSLLEKAKALITTQKSIIDSFAVSIGLWDQLEGNKPLQTLPFYPSTITLDPDLSFNNYQIEAERVLTNLKESLGLDSDTGAAQEAATDYLASLKVLVQYGKAINRKIIAYTSQLTRAINIKSQIAAVQKAQMHWKELNKVSQSDSEKLAALKGIIKTRMETIKRSIYIAWVNYRNAYLYLYFSEPNVKMNPDMDAASLKNSFAEVHTWVVWLLGSSPEGQKVQLPNDDVKISLNFPIVTRQSKLDCCTETMAFLTPRTDKTPAVININIPKEISQLKDLLPKGGNVAIWIKEAKFFIEGVKPNSKGNVILNVSTSGTYENGFAPDRMFKFETKGLQGNYGYGASGNVYMPWEVNTEVYMTPTLFTQWSLTFDENGGDPDASTTLNMDLTLAFRTRVEVKPDTSSLT